MKGDQDLGADNPAYQADEEPAQPAQPAEPAEPAEPAQPAEPALQAEEPAPPYESISASVEKVPEPQAEGKEVKVPEFPAEDRAETESSTGEPERQQWGSGLEFLMSCIAMSVGLGNVWRFPFTAYENGGGAFLIPYIIVLIIIGRPLYYLEMELGQFTSRGCIKIWSMVPALKGVGYGQIMATAVVMTYYTSTMALTLFYMGSSFQKELPWSRCRDEPGWENCIPARPDDDGPPINPNGSYKSSAELYFLRYVLNEKENLEDGIGDPDWRLLLSLLGTWIIIVLVVVRGVKSSGKAAYFLAMFPYVVLIVLLIRGCTLPGAADGLIFFVEPKWEKLGDASVWYAAVTQAFFSLNVGFGALINYSSFNNFRHNIYRDAMIVTTMDTFTSLLAGCTIFSILGNLAYVTGSPVGSVVESGAGLAFISYPDAISKFDAVPQLFAVLFFLMMLTLGVGSGVALVTAIVSTITDDFPKLPQWMVICAVSAMGFAVAIVYITPGGQWILSLVDKFGVTFPVLALMCVEMGACAWIYGVNTMSNDLKFMLKRPAGPYWRLTWGFITPVFLIVVLIYAAVQDERLTYANKEFPDHYYVVGWVLLAVEVSMVPIFLVKEIFDQYRKGLRISEAIVEAFRPSALWGPSDKRERRAWLQHKEYVRRQEMAALGVETRGHRVARMFGCGQLPELDDNVNEKTAVP